jgi:serine/threonine protein kinase
MTNCPEVSQLRLLLEGDGTAEFADLATHVDGCPTCLERLDELARQDAPLLPLPPAKGGRTPEADEALAYLSRTVPRPPNFVELDRPPSEIDPAPPEIPGFESLELVGRGGSGYVYRAWQAACDRWVALKILNPARGLGSTPRVLREARFLGRLDHPHIVRILDSGTHQGQPYLVMEWIAGGALDQRLEQGPLSIQAAAQLGVQVASALELVHALGIVHRDLKPANVLLEERASASGGLIAKLTDFGIARDEQAEEQLTSTGIILGTPQYMSPEQTGLSPDTVVVGPASDIYGVGALLFACLTGQAPHSGGGNLSTLSRVARFEPPPPRTLRGDIPVDLDTIVVKCLRRNPARRYRSAGELGEDLNRFLQGLPIAARPYTPVERLGNWLRRHPAAAATLAMVGLLLLTLFGGGLYHLRSNQALIGELSTQRDLAQEQKRQAEAAARRADASRDEASRLSFSASRALLLGESPQPEERRRFIEVVRAKQLAESADPETLTVSQAEVLGSSLLSLTYAERRFSLFDFHEEDSQRILLLARRFPASAGLRRAAALSLCGKHAIQLGQDRPDAARQTLQALLSLGELEPNEQNGALDSYRNQARHEERRGEPQRALATMEEACTLAERFLERHRADHFQWFILLDLQNQCAEIATRLSIPETTAFAPFRKTLQRFLELPSEDTEQTLLGRGRVVHRQIERALSAQRFGLARELLDATRPDVATALRLVPHSAGVVNFRLERARYLSGLAFAVPLTAVEEEELQQSLEGARQFQREHPCPPDMIQRFSQALLQQARHQLAWGRLGESESTAREVLALLTPLSLSPAPFADFFLLLCDAHRCCSDALRGSPRVAERRLHLAAACQFADANRRPGVALELVKLLLEIPDLVEAERVRDWIPHDNPAWAQAQSLIDDARVHTPPIDSTESDSSQRKQAGNSD